MRAMTSLVTLWEQIAEAHAADLTRWYDEVQRQALIQKVPGMAKVRRYAIPERPGSFLTWCEVEQGARDAAAAVERAGGAGTPAYECERMSLRLMRDVGVVRAADTPWLYIVHTDIPDDIVDEYNEWYDNEHLPRLVTVPGVIRARRYTAVIGAPCYLTAYELTDRDAFESPEGLKARKTPWTARMRSLFQNTRRSMCRLI